MMLPTNQGRPSADGAEASDKSTRSIGRDVRLPSDGEDPLEHLNTGLVSPFVRLTRMLYGIKL
ncbi:hypothetical protein NL500_31130, partial [Klebsiella pneumoniae]|nr:hypothetical protein [Klebsiella pneumoniae]